MMAPAIEASAMASLWYFFQALHLQYTQKARSLFPRPMTVASLQLVAGAACAAVRLSRLEQSSWQAVGRYAALLVMPTVFHVVAHLASARALASLDNPCVHMARASEPLISALAFALLGGSFGYAATCQPLIPPCPLWVFPPLALTLQINTNRVDAYKVCAGDGGGGGGGGGDKDGAGDWTDP
eukprot:jgi/Mesen1/8923/ME000548S08439